jgi:hypothetical protein
VEDGFGESVGVLYVDCKIEGGNKSEYERVGIGMV